MQEGNSTIKKIFNRFWGLTAKELKMLINDRLAMVIAILIPIIVILILAIGPGGIEDLISSEPGFTGRGNPPREPPTIGLIDRDQTTLSVDFVNLSMDYQRTGHCAILFSEDQNELEVLLGKNQIDAIIIVPMLFEYNLSIHFPALLTIVIDTIDTIALQTTEVIISKLVNEFKYNHNFTGVFNVQYYRDGLPDKGRLIFLGSPLFFPLCVFSIAALIACQSIVSDIPKDRMVLTPTNKFEILAAKLVAHQMIMSIIIIIMTISSVLLGLEIRGSGMGKYLIYFMILFTVALSGVVWGLFMSAIAKVPLNALQYFIFLFLFLVIVGFFVENPGLLALSPIDNGENLMMNVAMRGEPIWWNLKYFGFLGIQIVVLYVLTQIIFLRKKTLL
ncbi:MAG: ABC transporter permease [Candidatus Lokiarchaeota archaeon]|nr:ABC transporter permease [Candidatus Lokiarchaeota archaeon]